METYQVKVGNDVRMTFSADFAQASSPIWMDDTSTPFQVADARHRPIKAARLLIDWCNAQGVSAVEDGEEWEIVEVEEAQTEA